MYPRPLDCWKWERSSSEKCYPIRNIRYEWREDDRPLDVPMNHYQWIVPHSLCIRVLLFVFLFLAWNVKEPTETRSARWLPRFATLSWQKLRVRWIQGSNSKQRGTKTNIKLWFGQTEDFIQNVSSGRQDNTYPAKQHFLPITTRSRSLERSYVPEWNVVTNQMGENQRDSFLLLIWWSFLVVLWRSPNTF